MSRIADLPSVGEEQHADRSAHDQRQFGPGRPVTVLFHMLLGGFAVLLFGGLASFLHSQQERTMSETAINAHVDEQGRLRPLVEVVDITRSLKLVTVVVDTRVKTENSIDSWRGDVSAAVTTRVRYVYGVDLSGLEPSAFTAGKILGGYDIVIPRPERIAIEVDGSEPLHEEVKVSGTRFRSRAGEYYLGLARKKVYQQARTNVLSEEEMQEVYATTKQQIEDLVRKFVGPQAYVNVRYENQ